MKQAGESEWGPLSDAATPDTEPGTPAAPNVEFADSALIVSWCHRRTRARPITGYELEIGGAASRARSRRLDVVHVGWT